MKPTLGTNTNAILDEFKRLSTEYCGRRIIEAFLVGGGTRFRWQGSGKLGIAVGDIGIRDAKSVEYDELEEGIELGQVQIRSLPLYFRGNNPRDVIVLHEATGFPLDENSPAAIRQRERWARADALRAQAAA